jgi:putative methyltransferase (TIGR04325 family)
MRIKKFIPPIVADFVKGNSILKIQKLITNLLFKKVDRNISTYDDATIAEIVIKKSILFRDALFDNKNMQHPYIRSIIATVLAAIKNNSDIVNVLDFGGAGGIHYYIAKLVLGNAIQLNWHIVETKAMVNAGRKIEDEQLRYFDSIESAQIENYQYDLVFSSGTLQCCSNQYEILDKLISLQAPNLFITRTPLSDKVITRSFIQYSKLSANGPGPLPFGYKDEIISYPIYFFNKQQFELNFKNKYVLRFKIEEERDLFNVESELIHHYVYFFDRVS